MVGGGPPPGLAARRRRPRLSARLDGALQPTTRLTVVAAPPGYGKSVAVAGWIEDRGLPVAWVDLDATARDPARLARMVLAALATARPAAAHILPAITFGTTPDPVALGDLLLDAIATDDTDLVLVLDDCHLADSPDALAVLRRLVDRMPPFAHLVLVGRDDPAIPVGRLRAHGGLVEIRAADLRFSAEEGCGLLEDAGARADEVTLGALVARTEGWAAALQLTAISLAGGGGALVASDAVSGTNRYLIDYLGDEVMAGLDPDLGDVLAAAAVAATFSSAMIAAMAGRDDVAPVLQRAERSNLFVVPLDSERRWYRMHGLFADYLRSRLPAAEQRRLHAAAAAWLDAEGLGRDAVTHGLEADEPGHATRLVAREGRAVLEAGELRTLLGWIERLPQDVRDAVPEIAWLEAWGRFYTGDLAGAAGIAVRATAGPGERGPGPGDRSAAIGRLLVLRALIGTTLDPAAEQIASEGIELVGDDLLFRSLGLQAAGLAQLARGDVPGSLPTLRAAFQAAEASGNPIAVLPAVNPLGHALVASGRRDEAETVARRVLAAFPGLRDEPLAIAWPARMSLGIALLEGGDVVGAREALERGLAAATSLGVGPEVLGWALPAIAMARQATGDTDGAFAVIERGSAPSLAFPSLVDETRARLALARGDIAAASRWADQGWPETPVGSPLAAFLGASAALTVARVRLAEGRAADAMAEVASARAFYEPSGSIPDLVSCGLIAATGALVAGDRTTARAELAGAVRLAAPGGYVRRFVDDGRLLAGLLADVEGDAEPVRAFVRRVREALKETDTPRSAVRRGTSVLVAPDGTLVESLTPRELDILRLLATGARNADVAGALGMSPGTAKWHVAHVLAKLGVTSRTGAVVRGQELGLV